MKPYSAQQRRRSSAKGCQQRRQTAQGRALRQMLAPAIRMEAVKNNGQAACIGAKIQNGGEADLKPLPSRVSARANGGGENSTASKIRVKSEKSNPTATRRKLRQHQKITFRPSILATEIEPKCLGGLVKRGGAASVGRAQAAGGIEPQRAQREF